jgi:hypothetical protein
MPRRLNPQQQERTSLAGAFTKFTRRAAGIFDRSDKMLFMQEESRLGIWIGGASNRHTELFERIARECFKEFAPQSVLCRELCARL